MAASATSTIKPRDGGGFIITGQIAEAEVFASPNLTIPGAPDTWIRIRSEDTDGSISIEIDCLDHLIEALSAIRDKRAQA